MSNFLDRVLESFTTTGTGTINLAGAATGFRTFVAGLGGSGVVFYFAFGDPAGADAANWEFGYGTLTDASPDTLTRTLISSSSGSLISWAAGTKYVMSSPIASILMGWALPYRGTTRPGWLKAGGLWLKTNGSPYPILYHYDGTDDIALFEIDETNNLAFPALFSFNAQTGTSYTVLKTDRQKIVTHSNASAIAVTLPQATGDFGAKFFYGTRNLGAGLVTITPTTSTIDGAATLTIPQGFSTFIFSDGTNYVTVGLTKVTNLPQAVAFTGVISPAQLTANTDNWNPTGLSAASTIRVSTDASRNLTGIVAPTNQQALLLQNVGAQNLVLVHDATSTAANRFYCPNSANFTLKANAACWVVYDTTSSRWRVVSMEVAGATTITQGTDLVKNPMAATTQTTQAHGLGGIPRLLVMELECTTADGSFEVGDIIVVPCSMFGDNNTSTQVAPSVQWDATNIYFNQLSNAGAVVGEGGAASQVLVLASWKATIHSYKW